jgi:HTH-type transcriptional regulator / antitoxin HipB
MRGRVKPFIFMIFNERQYGITQAQLRKFQAAIAETTANAASETNLNQQLRYQVHLDALNSQIESLEQELKEYQKLKTGKITKLKFDSLTQLPEALIKARIVRGLTQEQLGDLLGLKAQQIQRYEATAYAGASLTKILAVQKALNIEITEEVIFK